MNYLNKNFGTFTVKSLIVLLLFAVSFIMLQASAKAQTPPNAPIPSNFLPKAADFEQGNGVYLIAARYGGNYLLDAPVSTVRLYSPTRNNVINIVNGGHCIGSGPDRGPDESEATTTYRVWVLSPDTGNTNYTNTPFLPRTGPADFTITSDSIGCQPSYPFTVNAPGSTPPIDIGPAEGKFAFEIEAIMTGPPGWNMFKYNVASGGGRFSYYAGSGDRFGLKDDSPGLPPSGERGNFNLGFAAGCGVPRNQDRTFTLRWFDADAGESNQIDNPVRTRIIEYNSNNNPTGRSIPINPISGATAPGGGRLNITSGNDVSGSAEITIRGYNKYAWVWENIHSSNGIQFQLPFDSYNTLIDFNQDCTQSSTSASCVARPPNPQTRPLNSGAQINIRVTNTGTTTWNSNYQLRQTSPGGAAIDMNRPVSAGEFRDITFTINPRASPQTVIFEYNMFTDSGIRFPNTSGPLCTAQITWGAGGARTGSVTARCNYITYEGNELSPDSNGNVPNGTPYRFTPQRGAHNATDYTLGWYISVTVTHQVNTAGMQPAEITAAKITDADPGYQLYVRIPDSVVASRNLQRYLAFLTPQKANGLPEYVFEQGQGMRPIIPYTWTIRYGLTNQEGVDNNGNGQQDYQETHPSLPAIDDNVQLSECMKIPTCEGLTQTPDLEPGESGTFRYRMNFAHTAAGNLTMVQYPVFNGLVDGSPNPARFGGYSLTTQLTGGLSGSVNRIDPFIIDGTQVSSNIEVEFNVTANYRGQVIVSFYWGNDPPPQAAIPLGQSGQTYWRYNEAVCTTEITPKTRPTLKVTNGDVSTGGAFASGFTCPAASDPRFEAPRSGDVYAGGIRTFARPDISRGSSVDFAAFSMGLIHGSVGGPLGFYSNALNPQRPKYLTFANTTGDPLGGLLGGTSPNATAHCAPDYFNKPSKTGTKAYTSPGTINLPGASGQSYYNGPLTINPGTLGNNVQASIYVRGDVFISGNINYPANWTLTAGSNQTPYLAIIAEGNIHVDPGVSNIDGLYVAQPRTDGSGGHFSTCSPDVTRIANASEITNRCRSQFTLNGAVIAQKIHPLRSVGTLFRNDPPADRFNFTPAMIVGIPAFKPNDGGVVVPNSLEGLFRLPPVF